MAELWGLVLLAASLGVSRDSSQYHDFPKHSLLPKVMTTVRAVI
jgi:hypothetical protein